jgi:hypothetical protein
MGAIGIQQPYHVPAARRAVESLQKDPKVLASLTWAYQKEAVARADVKRPENHAPCIAASERHPRRLPPFGPIRAQGREQQQVSFILAEYHAARPQLLEPPAQSALFFSGRVGL